MIDNRWDSKTVLVTGGTGYMGSLLVKKLLETGVEYVITYSRRWEASERLTREVNDRRLVTINGDIRDKASLDDVMRRFHPDAIIHAAAYKSVPSAETNAREAITINLNGTMNVVDSAVEHGVEELCFISTDKACAGLNVYGKSKAAAEAYVTSIANRKDIYRRMKFFSVRYGNVVGSTGSVFELYAKSKTYPVTNRHMTRFWFRENSAAEFVLDSFDRAYGGEVFVPYLSASTMGDLVAAWQEVAPKEVTEIGTRVGEKQHEQMISSDEMVNAVWLEGWQVFAILPEGDVRFGVSAFDKLNEEGDCLSPVTSFSSYNTRRYPHEELVKLVKEYLDNR
jgi:UDP-N-acetylglucosamine 4,6-dehydratase/5-epimerase